MRDTNIQSVLFPVSLQSLFLYNRNKPIQNFVAVVGKFDDKESIFSIVTKDYHLIKNEEALELGITAYQKLLDKTSKNDFEIFNVIYPKTRSSVIIDIIHKEFKVNILKKEVYVPYLRIINSYNRTKALTFDIGFCRKLCDNGVIFEKDIVKIKIYHQRRNFNQNQLFDSFDITRFNKYIEEFRNHLLKTQEIKIDKKYFIATSAKALQMKFDIRNTNKKIKSKALKDLGLFISQITPLASKYYKDFGPTAYAVFNTVTDYASNVDDEEENYLFRRNAINRNQRLAGEWLKNFHNDYHNTDFDFPTYLKEYKDFLQYSFN